MFSREKNSSYYEHIKLYGGKNYDLIYYFTEFDHHSRHDCNGSFYHRRWKSVGNLWRRDRIRSNCMADRKAIQKEEMIKEGSPYEGFSYFREKYRPFYAKNDKRRKSK